jgi:hypothetical protein
MCSDCFDALMMLMVSRRWWCIKLVVVVSYSCRSISVTRATKCLLNSQWKATKVNKEILYVLRRDRAGKSLQYWVLSWTQPQNIIVGGVCDGVTSNINSDFLSAPKSHPAITANQSNKQSRSTNMQEIRVRSIL